MLFEKTNRKILAAFLAVTLVLTLVNVSAAGSNPESFSIKGVEYGYQGDGSAVESTDLYYDGTSSLFVSGRNADWHGVKWNVAGLITKEGSYYFSAYVRGTSSSNGSKIGYTLNAGGSQWTGLGEVTLSSSEWRRIEGTVGISSDNLNAITGNGYADIYPSASNGDKGDYYIDAVSFEPVDDMSICGQEPYAQGGSISRTTDGLNTGNDTLYASGRVDFWNGVAWTIPADKLGKLGTSTTWLFDMSARSKAGNHNLMYNFEFWYNGEANQYRSVSAIINDNSYSHIIGTVDVTGLVKSNLTKVVIYPYSLDSLKTDYYVDKVSLTAYLADDMTLCGQAPYANGGNITRDFIKTYKGRDSIKSYDRTDIWNGLSWVIPKASLGELENQTIWKLSMMALAESGNMDICYNLQFWYDEDVNNCLYGQVNGSAKADDWTKIEGTIDVSSFINANLDHVTIYPTTSDCGTYYIDEVSLSGMNADNMTLCGQAPYSNGEGNIVRDNQIVYEGADSIKSIDRVNPWNGTAWNIPASSVGDLQNKFLWNFSLMARSASGEMTLSYNFEFWYTDGSDNRYLTVTKDINSNSWTKINGNWVIDSSYFDKLDRIVVYPMTAEGQYGEFYVDSVSLTGGTVDDMTIGGKAYFVHGDGKIDVDFNNYYTGKDSLYISERTLVYSGAGWDVKDYIQSKGLGTWEFTAYVRTTSGSMNLSYNLYLKYEDGTENWMRYGLETCVNSKGWTKIGGAGYFTTGTKTDFKNLEVATLYPCTAGGQLNSYYIDGVSLVKTGTEIPEVPIPDYLFEYFPIDGDFEGELAAGTLGYPFNHGDPVKLTVTDKVAAKGTHSLLVSDRSLTYSGAGYDVCAFLRNSGWGNWFVSAKAMAVDEPMSLSYSIYLKFEDGTEDWLFPGTSYYVTKEGWTDINSDFCGGDILLVGSKSTYDFSKLVVATLYPCTAEGQLGSYYLDDVQLYRGDDNYTKPVITFEGEFPLDGTFEEELNFGAPGHLFIHGEGAILTRTNEDAYEGSYCLRVGGRQSNYSGAGWIVTDYLKQEGWGDWYLSAYAKAIDGEYISVSYSIYMQFSDGTEDWLTTSTSTFLSNKMWQQINVDTAGNLAVLKSQKGVAAYDFSKLTYAVVYPGTNPDNGIGGEYSDYLIDDVKLWREEPKTDNDDNSDDTPIIIDEPTEAAPVDEKTSEINWLVLGLIIGGIVLAGVAVATILIIKKRKNNLEK